MSQLRAEGYKIILDVDVNENSADRKLAKVLLEIRLIEAFY